MEQFDTRPYNDSPYLIFPGALPFKIKLGHLSPSLRVFVYQKFNLFGDASPLEIAGLDIIFKLYNTSGLLIASGPARISNTETSEVEYVWSEFDIKEVGTYYAEFIFKDIDDQSFVLPSRDRIQIVVF